MPLGAIANGENGWEMLTPGEDEGIVAGPDGSDEFKMSSDPGNTAFGGPYSPGLSVAAGEPDAGALFSGETISYNFQAIDLRPMVRALRLILATPPGRTATISSN